MRVLFVLENYYPHIGGVEVVFKNLCEGLAKKGYEVDVVTHRLKGTKNYEAINDVKIHRVRCFHSRYLFTFFSIAKAVRLAKKADLIHTTTFNGAFPAWFASKILKKKCLININEVWVGKWRKITEMGWLNAKVHDLLERMIYLLNFDMYISISESTKKQMVEQGISPKKIRVVYPGIDYKHWNPKTQDGMKIRKKLGLENKFVYLFTGRPGISKGLEYLIRAVPLISKRIPCSMLLAIVSKDPAYKKRYAHILKVIGQLGIKSQVMLHDPVSYKELPRYVNAADCVVVPSLSEGFGFCAVEACAMGKPVVASSTTSLPEVVSGSYVLVKPRNPESIAEGVVNVYNKKTANSKLKKFDVTDNVMNNIKVYKEII